MVFKKNDETSKLAWSKGGKITSIINIAKKVERINIYNLSPNLCQCCNKILTYEKRHKKYCSHSCAAKINNKNIIRNGEPRKKCIDCGKRLYTSKERCKICSTNFRIFNGHSNISHQRLKKYLIKNRGHQCERCKLVSWQNNLIPLDTHHIDGNKKNNKQENLQLLCPNCHHLTNNFGYKKRKL